MSNDNILNHSTTTVKKTNKQCTEKKANQTKQNSMLSASNLNFVHDKNN